MSSIQSETLNEKKEEATPKPTPTPIWNPRFSLDKLSKPGRVGMIVNHRMEVASMFKMSPFPAMNLDTLNPAGTGQLPYDFADLKPITLERMYPQDFNYFGRKIELEVIEDAMSFMRIMLMCQDTAGDVIFVAFYCDSPSCNDRKLQEKVGYGCKITIAEPWLKYALDGRIMIRIDENSSLFIHEVKDPKKCRFCGKADSEQKCARCKRAFYCSRECQIHDWKILKHKDICDAYKAGSS